MRTFKNQMRLGDFLCGLCAVLLIGGLISAGAPQYAVPIVGIFAVTLAMVIAVQLRWQAYELRRSRKRRSVLRS